MDTKVKETQKLIKASQMNSLMLTNLISDLLDLAKEESTSFKINYGIFNLVESVEKAFDCLRYISEIKQVKTQLVVEPEDALYLHNLFGDQQRVQ